MTPQGSLLYEVVFWWLSVCNSLQHNGMRKVRNGIRFTSNKSYTALSLARL